MRFGYMPEASYPLAGMQMYNSYMTLKTLTAAAVMAAVVLTGTVHQAQAQGTAQPATKAKNYKDQGEYDIYNEVTKDVVANNFTKAVTDLDTWKSKYPESDYKDARAVLYVQAYNGAKQFAKAVDAAGELMSKDLDATFSDPKSGPQDVVRVLFTTCQAIVNVQNPTPEELATGQKAAKMLMHYNRKPEGVADAAWGDARKQLQTTAQATLMTLAVAPGQQAMAKNPPDCATAETVFTKALQDYPDKSFISYNLGRALNCLARATPDKAADIGSRAIYEFVRAAATDPSLGGSANADQITKYADSAYTTFHGSNDGLDALKAQAKSAALPPAGFTIETAAAIATKKQNEFQEKYPQLAMWLGIKSQLADPSNGMSYFNDKLKDAEVPKLKGMLLEGKPACRSKELLVAVPLPDATGTPTAEITLKLDAALTGKPEPGEIQWQGVPAAFTQDPFMLTMETEKAKIEGLKSTPCAAAAPRPGVKKAAPKKK